MRDMLVHQPFRFPNTFVEFSENEVEQTIQHRCEQQVSKRASQLAIRRRSKELTYSELNRAANRIAFSLRTEMGDTCFSRSLARPRYYGSCMDSRCSKSRLSPKCTAQRDALYK